MKKVKVYTGGEDSETTTSFRFNQPEGCNKTYNCYKNIEDNFSIQNIISLTVYGFNSDEERLSEFESFKSSLPKAYQKYVKLRMNTNWLNEVGFADYSKSEPAIEISVTSRHKYNENQIKKVKRLYDETINFFNLK